MIAVLSLAALLGATAAAAALSHPRPSPAGHACLAVGPNVCFSGSTEWVARAAASQTPIAQHVELLVADAN
jgi:hypothetical protein